jgi:hypothetical protein
MASPTNTDPSAPTLAGILVVGGKIDGYIDGASRTRVAEVPVEGMVMHWSAEVSEGALAGTLWRQRALADQFLANVLAETFTEIAGSEEQSIRPRPDYSYEMSTLARFVPGPDISAVVGRKLGEAQGAVLVRSDGTELSQRPGLLAQLWITDGSFDFWLDEVSASGAYETLETIPLHTLFVNPGELELFPKYPPNE